MNDLRGLYTVGQNLLLEFRKWDERPHYHWGARVLEVHEECVLVGSKAGTVFEHISRGKQILLDHDAELAFWKNRWYSGGPDLEAGGTRVLEYYFNLGTPPEFLPEKIVVIDLEIDILLRPDLSSESFDWQEFLEAKQAFGYPDWLERQLRSSIKELLGLVEQGGWPLRPAQINAADFSWMKRIPD